jgi:hypothetical protein
MYKKKAEPDQGSAFLHQFILLLPQFQQSVCLRFRDKFRHDSK